MPIEVVVMKAVSAENDRHAVAVRAALDQHHVTGINLMSSAGSGKTTLLEAVLKRQADRLRFGVIEGDLFTSRDAERIERHHVPVVQVNTQGSCHMTAHMVAALLPRFDLASLDVLVVENIGNLICPTSYDLGEHWRVACLSTAEGADKIEKYPKLFSISHANVITKADLAAHVDFDIAAAARDLQSLNPAAPVFITSARTGEGIAELCDWLAARAAGGG